MAVCIKKKKSEKERQNGRGAHFYTLGFWGALGKQLSPAVGALLIHHGLRQEDQQ